MARMYFELVGQMKKQLAQIDKWLDAATTFAESKKFDPNAFLGFRLAVVDAVARSRSLKASPSLQKATAFLFSEVLVVPLCEHCHAPVKLKPCSSSD